MGCIHSKKEINELQPNVYRVINIDENGVDLCSGQLEITESDIILYREGRESTIWPLHSLRRYGFEGEIFSFESGRRCETGEGIYAFRCKRASSLFRKLQQQIQLRNVINDSTPYPVTRLTPSPQGRQTLQASVVHRSSIDNGQDENGGQTSSTLSNIASHSAVMRNANHSPRSPSSVDILEVMPLNQRSETATNQVTNVYQVREFKREHNNNQESAAAADVPHAYSNDFNRDLAILRCTLKEQAARNTMREIEEENRYLENRYINETGSKNPVNDDPLSPTLSSSSEHYAQLSIEQQESARMYVNIVPNDNNVMETAKNDGMPTTPLTPKQVEYCNLNISNKPEVNSYANLLLGDMVESLKNLKPPHHCTVNDHSQKFSESDTFTSMSPVEETEVNYAVLDIDTNKDNNKNLKDLTSPEKQTNTSGKGDSTTTHSSLARRRLVSQNSMEKTLATTNLTTGATSSIGYTTIDFDKTVALTSVAAGEIGSDGSRKTRHNSSNINSGSPNNDKCTK